MPNHIAVLGDGAWGTAIATLLAHNGHTVKLWCFNKDVAHQIDNTHINTRYLPNITLSSLIDPTIDLEDAIADSSLVFQAIPIKFLRSVLADAKKYANKKQLWVSLSKGIENNTLFVATEIVSDVFGFKPLQAVVAGPSFAQEVAQHQPTAVVVASENRQEFKAVSEVLKTGYFCCNASKDLKGVQLASALKNVITLAIGILDGAGYKDNTKAFIFTQGLYEIGEILKAKNADQKTIYGLAGVGDLVLTAMGKLSKNLQVGHQLGKGEKLDAILKHTGFIPEGINTIVSLMKLIEKYKLQLPICQGIYQVIHQNKSIDAFLSDVIEQMPCG